MTEQYVDLVEAGIIDPAKVTRSALENAASVAAMILTTEALVTERPEQARRCAAGGGMPDYDEDARQAPRAAEPDPILRMTFQRRQRPGSGRGEPMTAATVER